MDYGEPAAQFMSGDVYTKGKPFVGKKVTVKGIVTKIDVVDPNAAWVELEEGIRCNFGKFKAMAESSKVGDTVYVDGVLTRCGEGDVLMDPAQLRDSTASFAPQ